MLRYIDSSINDDGDERLTVDGRDLYEAMVDQVEKDLKPAALPNIGVPSLLK